MKTIPRAPKKKKSTGGPPHQQAVSGRRVSLTLTEKTLRGLGSINPDRSLAVEKLLAAALPESGAGVPLVEFVEHTARTGLLITAPSLALRSIPFLNLVEVAPNRYLLAVDAGHDSKSLECAVREAFHDVPESEIHERQLLKQLLGLLKNLSQADRLSSAEVLFDKLAGKPTMVRPAPRAGQARS